MNHTTDKMAAPGKGRPKHNQRLKHNTPEGRGARARKHLTPGQRGRFWQSVGAAIEAARAVGV